MKQYRTPFSGPPLGPAKRRQREHPPSEGRTKPLPSASTVVVVWDGRKSGRALHQARPGVCCRLSIPTGARKRLARPGGKHVVPHAYIVIVPRCFIVSLMVLPPCCLTMGARAQSARPVCVSLCPVSCAARSSRAHAVVRNKNMEQTILTTTINKVTKILLINQSWNSYRLIRITTLEATS